MVRQQVIGTRGVCEQAVTQQAVDERFLNREQSQIGQLKETERRRLSQPSQWRRGERTPATAIHLQMLHLEHPQGMQVAPVSGTTIQ